MSSECFPVKYSNKNILYKALYSSATGLPISMILTASMIPFIYWVTHTQHWMIAALSISFPFFIASVGRQYIIDWAYQKHNVDISPAHIFSVLGRYFKK